MVDENQGNTVANSDRGAVSSDVQALTSENVAKHNASYGVFDGDACERFVEVTPDAATYGSVGREDVTLAQKMTSMAGAGFTMGFLADSTSQGVGFLYNSIKNNDLPSEQIVAGAAAVTALVAMTGMACYLCAAKHKKEEIDVNTITANGEETVVATNNNDNFVDRLGLTRRNRNEQTGVEMV